MARLQALIVAIPILSVYFLSPTWSQESPQESVDAQRCNGELQVSAQEQIASCSALIDSRSFSGKTLAIIYSNRGILWFEQSDYYKAVVDLGEAIALDPLNATSFYHRGLAKLRIGDPSGKADLAKAEELNPEFRAVVSATPSLAAPNRAGTAALSKRIIARSKNLKNEEPDRHPQKEVSDRSKKQASYHSTKQAGDHSKNEASDHSKKEVSHRRGKAQRNESGEKSQKKVAGRPYQVRESSAPIAAQPPSGNFIPGIPLLGLGIGFGGFGFHH